MGQFTVADGGGAIGAGTGAVGATDRIICKLARRILSTRPLPFGPEYAVTLILIRPLLARKSVQL